MINEISELLGTGAIYDWGLDEDGDTVVVFESWDGLKKLGDVIVAYLIAQGLVDAKSRCGKSTEKYSSGACIEIYAEKDKVAEVSKALAKCFGVEKFRHDYVNDEFSFPGDDDADALCYGKFSIETLIDKAGLEMGFSDTYERCSRCNVLIYTQPTHYGDCGRFRNDEESGETICLDCDKKDPESYLSDYLDDVRKGRLRGFHIPIPAGFKQIGTMDTFMGEPRFSPTTFERGLHTGQNDNPKNQYKALCDAGVDTVIFDISTSQFYVEWTVWVRETDYDVASTLLNGVDLADAKGPSDYAKEALQKCSMEQREGHVTVNTINTDDGTVATRHVSHADFIEKGIK